MTKLLGFLFTTGLTDSELKKLGELILTWSGTEHMLGSALSHLLRVSDDEATALVYPMGLQTKLHWIYTLAPNRATTERSQYLIKELKFIMEYVQTVRNTVIHGILMGGLSEDVSFHLRSKSRSIRKEDVWAAETPTDYAATIVAHLCWELAGVESLPALASGLPLPDRPVLPESENRQTPTGKK